MYPTKMLSVMTDLPVREIDLSGTADLGSTNLTQLHLARDGSTLRVEWYPLYGRWLVIL